MQILKLHLSKLQQIFGIDMSNQIVIPHNTSSNLHCSYGEIEVNQETTIHNHHETEVFIIVDGTGSISTGRKAYSITSGDVIILEAFEHHTIKNLDKSKLRFIDLYWDEYKPNLSCLNIHLEDIDTVADPIFVCSTPPTPNGDLHLGHLSGPYLGADVLTRFLKYSGKEAYHITGSDDYQSYVYTQANKEHVTPKAIANKYSDEILSTLKMMDIHIDQFTKSSDDKEYVHGVQQFFSTLVKNGLPLEEDIALFDNNTNEYLYESSIRGLCPQCNSECNGNICEECGHPNICTDMLSPKSSISQSIPLRKKINRYTLSLKNFRNDIYKHHQTTKIPPRLLQLSSEIFDKADLNISITHPSSWGISPEEHIAGDKQVIWVWAEMAYSFLHSIKKIGELTKRSWNSMLPQDSWKIIHFFGYDNSFYHSILFPILYKIAFPQWAFDIDYNYNEFYLLNNLKFSTSRRHAIWGKDLLNSDNVDSIRFYLAATRGEITRSNFNIDECVKWVNNVLVGRWQSWLMDLGYRVHKQFNNITPVAGNWDVTQKNYLNKLQKHLDTLKRYYGPTEFSLNTVVKVLNNVIDDVMQFNLQYKYINANKSLASQYRTSIALELATAKLLAHVTHPIMPRFSKKLFETLGVYTDTMWPTQVELVADNTPISLSNICFFAPLQTNTLHSR